MKSPKRLPLALLLLASNQAFAQTPDLSARAEEFVSLFSASCLTAFPDGGAVDALMRDRKGEPLSSGEFAKRLKVPEKAGRAWAIKGLRGDYTLLVSTGGESTLPMSNSRACTLLTDAPKTMNVLAPFLAAKQDYAKRKGRTLEQASGHAVAGKGLNPGFVEVQMLSQLAGVFGYAQNIYADPQAEFRLEFKPLFQ